jgi:hypothetical protein
MFTKTDLKTMSKAMLFARQFWWRHLHTQIGLSVSLECLCLYGLLISIDYERVEGSVDGSGN